MIALRISDKEWKNIEFRKNKFRELESALDQAVSGRDNKVSSFLLGCLADGETGKAAAVEKLVASDFTFFSFQRFKMLSVKLTFGR